MTRQANEGVIQAMLTTMEQKERARAAAAASGSSNTSRKNGSFTTGR